MYGSSRVTGGGWSVFRQRAAVEKLYRSDRAHKVRSALGCVMLADGAEFIGIPCHYNE